MKKQAGRVTYSPSDFIRYLGSPFRLLDILQIQMSSLVSALENLIEEGCVATYRGRSSKGQKAIFYQITDAGRTRLRTEIGCSTRIAQGVTNVLGARIDPKTREPVGLSSRRRQMKARLRSATGYRA